MQNTQWEPNYCSEKLLQACRFIVMLAIKLPKKTKGHSARERFKKTLASTFALKLKKNFKKFRVKLRYCLQNCTLF